MSIFVNKLTFHRANSKKTDSVVAGEKVIVCVCDVHHGETLNLLRLLAILWESGNNKTHVQPYVLPPTSTSVQFHSMRMYYQVNEWRVAAVLI